MFIILTYMQVYKYTQTLFMNRLWISVFFRYCQSHKWYAWL